VVDLRQQPLLGQLSGVLAQAASPTVAVLRGLIALQGQVCRAPVPLDHTALQMVPQSALLATLVPTVAFEDSQCPMVAVLQDITATLERSLALL
jgi:hypothetical protein